MVQPPRKSLLERRDIIVGSRPYLEHSVCRPYGFTTLYDRHHRNGLGAARMSDIECLNPHASAGSHAVLILDERDIAYVLKCMCLPAQLCRLLEFLGSSGSLHFACEFPLQTFKIARQKLANVFDALRVFAPVHLPRASPRTQPYLPVETRLARGKALPCRVLLCAWDTLRISEREYSTDYFHRFLKLRAVGKGTKNSF